MNGSITLQSKLAGASALVGRLRGSVTMSNTIINGGASPYPKHVGPAAICSFSDGAQDAPLKSLKFYIEPSQDLHGYSYPWPGGGGKNLFKNTYNTVSTRGVTWTVNADGTITANGTATGGNSSIALPVDTTTLYGNYYYVACNGGSSATYDAYVWDSTASARVYMWDGTTASNGSVNGTLQEIKLVQGHTTSISLRIREGVTVNNVRFYPMIVRSTETDASWSPYENISPISGWSQVDGKQSGEDMTDYTPITISLGQTVYGGTVDAIAGKLVIDRAVATITSFSSKSGATANMVYAYQGITSTVKKPSADSVVVDLLSDKFVKSNFGSTGGLYGTDKLGIAVNTNGTVYVGFGKDGVSTLADANTWVAANPIQVVYPLATPIEVDLTPVSVSSLLGQNNIWCNTGETELDYYPAAASVVAVMNKSSKVYTSIPLNRIRYETYTVTPLMSLDLDSYRSESGLLIRNVLPTTKCKLEFETPMMDDTALEEVWSICKAGFNNLSERKLKLKYYDTLERKYRTGNFYLPDVPTPIRNIDETAGIINYGQIRFAFIEY